MTVLDVPHSLDSGIVEAAREREGGWPLEVNRDLFINLQANLCTQRDQFADKSWT